MWIWSVAAAAVLLLTFLRSEYEKNHAAVDTYRIKSKKMKREGMTLVFLSDLHGNRFGSHQEELLDAIARVKPDAVLIGGDMVVAAKKKGRVDLDAALLLISELAARYPVYYGHGNHESRMKRIRTRYGDSYEQYRTALELAGVIFLTEGRQETLGEHVMLSGFELEERYYRKVSPPDLEVSEVKTIAGEADPERFQILLAHSPVYFDTYADWGADLSLAGHFHGGTIRIPLLGGLMTPQFQFFYPYCGGIFEKNGKHLIVSRGLGTHSVNIRLNNRAQLVVVELQPEDLQEM